MSNKKLDKFSCSFLEKGDKIQKTIDKKYKVETLI